MRLSTAITAIVLWTLAPAAALSQQASVDTAPECGGPEVLVLGVYHMGNPGRDVANLEADDVLAPRRQAEIAELTRVLAEFEPTKIAVEEGFNSDAASRRYAEYLAGTHELTRNETEQIGFRLAGELGHEDVYAVDVNGEFPFPRVADYARANGRAGEFEAVVSEIQTGVEATDAYLEDHTVLETLLYMNADERVSRTLGLDYRITHLGEAWNWAGADLVAAWFHRNIRIHTNIANLIESPDERVLVIFGAGHLGWLRHNVESDPCLRLRTLAEVAG